MLVENPESPSNYTAILQEELMPAAGCAESIAVAYVATKTKELLGEEPLHITVDCSGDTVKNVKDITVPNSGGQEGIRVIVTLGITGRQADKKLEIISAADDSACARCRELINADFCEVNFAEDIPNLYIAAKVRGSAHTAEIVVAEHHTNIVRMAHDDVTVFEQVNTAAYSGNAALSSADRNKMTLRGLFDYITRVDFSGVSELLERQIRYNRATSQEGLDNDWGARIGRTILENWGSDAKTRTIAWAATGSDARMSGYTLSAVINSGSGDQGTAVTLPALVYVEEFQISKQKLYRALLISNLVSIYTKHFIGPLSAFCNAVNAACGAGAAIIYMTGGNEERIAYTVTNALDDVGGIVRDGVKPSCAAKIASSIRAAILAYQMSMRDRQFQPGEDIVGEDVGETIRNISYIGKVDMKPIDHEILNVMIDKIDVNVCV